MFPQVSLPVHLYSFNFKQEKFLADFLLFSLQGAIFTMHGNNDGYATGSKDGTVILWDNGFKPITKLEMINTPVGYEGDAMLKMFFKIPMHAIK